MLLVAYLGSQVGFSAAIDPVAALLAKNEPTVLINSNFRLDDSLPIDPLASTSAYYHFGIIYAIYARAIDISEFATYGSRLLREFSYNHSRRQLLLKVADGPRFSDGSPVTGDDIAYSIARVALHRGNLEPFRDIVGLSRWKKQSRPLEGLPQGIEVDSGKGIVIISFLKHPYHPYYWLTFPMCSIIKKSCLDSQGRLICNNVPTSGTYSIESAEAQIVTFRKRLSAARGPAIMHAAFLSGDQLGDYFDKIKDNHVIDAVEGFHYQGGIEATSKRYLRETGFVENWANVILMDRNSKAFATDRQRLFFARKIRERFERFGKNTSGSMIPVLSPGYLNLQELRESTAAFSREETEQMVAHFRRHPPVVNPHNRLNRLFASVTDYVLNQMGIRPQDDHQKANFLYSRISLESIDPLHAIRFVLGNTEIYRTYFPSHLETSLQNLAPQSLEPNREFNRQLYQDAAISVILSYGKFQLLAKNSPLAFREQFLRQDWQRFFEDSSE